MSGVISSYGVFTNNSTGFLTLENQVQTLSNQLDTGKKSTALTGYGGDVSQILDLQQSIASNQSYVENNKTVSTYLNGYDTAMTQLVNDGTQLQTSLESLSANNASTSSTLSSLINGLQVDITATLNTTIGNRFLFGGSNYTTQPVTDLTTIAAPTTPTAFTAAASTGKPPKVDYVPPYSTLASTVNSVNSPANLTAAQQTQVNQSYASQTVNITDSQKLSYGITANATPIQQLVYALQQAQAGATASDPERSQFLSNATSALTSALSGLQTLQNTNAQHLSVLTNEQQVQTTAISTAQTQLGDLQNVDSATVATELSNVQDQLQASFKVTSSVLNLTLLTALGG